MTEDIKQKPSASIKWLFIGCGGLIFAAVIALVIVLGISARSLFITIAPDEVGVVISPYETTGFLEKPLHPGNHMIRPFEDVKIYKVAREVYSSSSTDCNCDSNDSRAVTIQTMEGVNLIINYQVTYTINTEQAVQIYREWQYYYQDRFVIPQSKQVIREVTGQYNSSEIALTKRDEIEQAIFSRLKSDFSSSNFVLLDFKIEDVRLKNKTAQLLLRPSLLQTFYFVDDALRLRCTVRTSAQGHSRY